MPTGLLFLLPTLIWGSTWYAITFQLDASYPHPLWSLCWRFLLAALLLFWWCKWRFIPLRFSARAHAFFILQGLTLFGLNYWFFYEMERYVPSAFAAIMFSAITLLNSLNGALFLRNTIDTRVLIGGGIGIIGVVLMFWHDATAGLTQTNTATYTVLWAIVLGGTATYLASIGNITAIYNRKEGMPLLAINAWAMLYGAIAMALLAILLGKSMQFSFAAPYLWSFFYLSIFGTVIAFAAYTALLSRIGADRAAYVALLGPVVSLILSSVFEDFHWTILHVLGIICIALGNILAFVKKRRTHEEYE